MIIWDQRLAKHNELVREYFWEIAEVKHGLDEGDFALAVEVWYSLPEEVQISLWIAPTKGGILTTEERAKLKSPEAAHIQRELKRSWYAL
jgi:hypothetical protein